MFRFLKSKKAHGRVGIEIRPDGPALSVSRDNQLEYAFAACSAAERDSTLKAFVKEHGLDGLECHAVLPSDQYKTYSVERPQVEEEELVDAVRWKVKDLLDFDVNDAVMDAYEFPSDALRGRPQQSNVVVARKTVIQTIVELVSASGLVLESINVSDLALSQIALAHGVDEGRAMAMLYLRKGSGVLIFVKGELLYLSRHFDFSIEALNDPAQQDNVIQYLALEIQRSFDFFESQMGQIAPAELVMVGPDPNIPLSNMIAGSIAAKIVPIDLAALGYEEDNVGIRCLAAIGAILDGGDD